MMEAGGYFLELKSSLCKKKSSSILTIVLYVIKYIMNLHITLVLISLHLQYHDLISGDLIKIASLQVHTAHIFNRALGLQV